MSKLTYLVGEINAALEVYLSGRTGHQYNRTAFVLCDDCVELASKLFLLRDNPQWSDRAARGYKDFPTVNGEVLAVFLATCAADYPLVEAFLKKINARHTRRNKFFHSTDLLDLTFHSRDCVEAFCDLLDYGRLLFLADWDNAVTAAGSMETCEAVVRIDKKAYGDPGIASKMNSILGNWPCNSLKRKAKGCEIAHHAEDLHLRLAIRDGGKDLRDKLRNLL